MSGDEFGPDAVGIVRRYSDQILDTMPHNQLAQAVNAVEVSRQIQDNQPTVWREWLRFDTQEE